MPLPDGITPATVTGLFAGPDGDLLNGTVSFQPVTISAGGVIRSVVLVNPVLDVTIQGPTVGTVTDGVLVDGAGGLILAATGQADLLPAGWAYLVKEKFGALRRREYVINIPTDLDLADAAPLDQTGEPIPGSAVYFDGITAYVLSPAGRIDLAASDFILDGGSADTDFDGTIDGGAAAA